MPAPGAWPVAASIRSTARTESASSLAKPPEASREPATGPPKNPATSTNRNTASRLRRGWEPRKRDTRPERRGALGSWSGVGVGRGERVWFVMPRLSAVSPPSVVVPGEAFPPGRGRRTPGEVRRAPYGVVVASTTRRGRRPGSPDTRAAILAEARALFAANGYAGTSVRAIAAAAGVDAALVHHYFGTKDDLFLAALELPVDPREALRPVVEGGVDGAGERLLRIVPHGVGRRGDPAAAARPGPRGRSSRAVGSWSATGFLRIVLGPVGAAPGPRPARTPDVARRLAS